MPVYHSFRLTNEADLQRGIERYANAHRIKAGVLAACVGCLSRWRLRGADGLSLCDGGDRVEIVSATGTVSMHGCHLHISLAREDLSVIGGHLVEGCIVNTTAEVVIMEMEEAVFKREYDPSTGYRELVIEHDG